MSKSTPRFRADADCWRFDERRADDKVVGPRHCHRWTVLSPKSDDAIMNGVINSSMPRFALATRYYDAYEWVFTP